MVHSSQIVHGGHPTEDQASFGKYGSQKEASKTELSEMGAFYTERPGK